jgi:hypothetical protein
MQCELPAFGAIDHPNVQAQNILFKIIVGNQYAISSDRYNYPQPPEIRSITNRACGITNVVEERISPERALEDGDDRRFFDNFTYSRGCPTFGGAPT